MTISITFEPYDNIPEELRNYLARISGQTQGAAPVAEKPVVQPEPAAKAEPQPKPEPVAEVKLETVRAALAKLTKAGKAAQVKQLLQEFGAARLTEVKAEDYPALLAKAGEL